MPTKAAAGANQHGVAIVEFAPGAGLRAFQGPTERYCSPARPAPIEPGPGLCQIVFMQISQPPFSKRTRARSVPSVRPRATNGQGACWSGNFWTAIPVRPLERSRAIKIAGSGATQKPCCRLGRGRLLFAGCFGQSSQLASRCRNEARTLLCLGFIRLVPHFRGPCAVKMLHCPCCYSYVPRCPAHFRAWSKRLSPGLVHDSGLIGSYPPPWPRLAPWQQNVRRGL